MFKFTIFVTVLVLYQTITAISASGCRSANADIVFLLDASGSLGQSNFNLQKDFVANFSSTFDIGPNNVQISVVTFSSSPYEEFNLNANSNLAQLLVAINNVVYLYGSTKTDEALKFVRTESFTQLAGDRDGATNILIVMTDGKSDSPTKTITEASLIHQENIKVIAVGIGSGSDVAELQTLASNQNDAISVSSFDALHNETDRILSSTCRIEAESRLTTTTVDTTGSPQTYDRDSTPFITITREIKISDKDHVIVCAVLGSVLAVVCIGHVVIRHFVLDKAKKREATVNAIGI